MAISDTQPTASYLRGGKRVFPLDVTSKQVIDPQTGKTRIQYEYDEAEVDGAVTRAKILAAMRLATQEADTTDTTGATTVYTAAKERLKNSKVKTLSVPELNRALADLLDMLGIEYLP